MLFDDWMKQRRLLAALGVEEIDMLDDLASARDDGPEAPATDPAARHKQLQAFLAASGGM